MSKLFTTLTGCALSLALTIPAFAGTSKTAPITTPTASVAPAKTDAAKVVVAKGKHSKKGTHGKLAKGTTATPAPTPAPEKH
jgi:hypothetical protein